MTADDLAAAVRDSGAALRLVGRRLLVGPASRVPDTLLAELCENRAALVDLVSRSATLEEILEGDVEPTADMPATTSDVLAMPLRSFSTSGLAVPVLSRRLGVEIVLAGDDAVLDPGERRPVYRAAELALLHRLGPEMIDLVHEVKRLGSTIIPN